MRRQNKHLAQPGQDSWAQGAGNCKVSRHPHSGGTDKSFSRQSHRRPCQKQSHPMQIVAKISAKGQAAAHSWRQRCPPGSGTRDPGQTDAPSPASLRPAAFAIKRWRRPPVGAPGHPPFRAASDSVGLHDRSRKRDNPRHPAPSSRGIHGIDLRSDPCKIGYADPAAGRL